MNDGRCQTVSAFNDAVSSNPHVCQLLKLSSSFSEPLPVRNDRLDIVKTNPIGGKRGVS